MSPLPVQRAGQTRSLASSLDVAFDTLMRRVEHAKTLRERQIAIDTLFDRRRGEVPTHVAALPVCPPVASHEACHD